MLVDLTGEASGTFALLADLALQALQRFLVVGKLCFYDSGGAFRFRSSVFRRAERFAQLFGANVHIAHPRSKAFAFGVKPVLLRARRRAFHDRALIVRPKLLRLLVQPVKVCHPERDLLLAELVTQNEVFLRRFRLLAQRFNLHFQLGDLIADAQEVVLRAGKLTLGLVFPVAEAGNASSFFEYLAPVGGLGGDDLADAPLPDDRITVAAEAGIHQQLCYVTKTHLLAIDVVFALAAAVVAPGDADLVVIERQDPRRIIQHKRHLCKSHCPALLRAAENDVFHLPAAQHPRFLFAHDPEQCIRQIGFPAPVGPDDHGYIFFKAQPRLFGKRLEALEFQRF